uniref:Solute carrier family 2, facilitated glucose transporter member 5 n=1 Tax=Neogobius melanostomus TaxID=47308 RepID=A0A8C6UWR4_9GOBI
MTGEVNDLLECPLVFAAIFICGIGGTFQYGFCVSSLTSPSTFLQELVNITSVHRYGVDLEQWQISLIWSFTVSILCVGGLLSALRGEVNAGLEKSLLLNNIPALIGAVLMLSSKAAMSFEMIFVGRFLFGMNAGVSLIVHTIYLVECAPKELRGMVGVTVATFIALGKFCGQLLGLSELLGSRERWPWLLGFTVLTSLLQLLTLPLLPESPGFLLLARGDREACERAMKRLWGDRDYSLEMEEMLKEKAVQQDVGSRTVLQLMRNRDTRWQLISVLVTFTTLQLCGINAVYFYSFEVFRQAGIHEEDLRYAALGTGLCELFSSVTLVIPFTGKKRLLFRGYMGMSVTLALLTLSMYLQTYLKWMPYCSMVLIFQFIFFFASGISGATSPLPGELFTQEFRSAAFTVATSVNWSGLFFVGMIFPILVVRKMDYFCFLIFLFFCASTGLYVKFYLPETKNLSPLEIAAEFKKIHSKPVKTHSNEHTCYKDKIRETKL